MEIYRNALDRHITGNYGEEQFLNYDGDAEELPESDYYMDLEEVERLAYEMNLRVLRVNLGLTDNLAPLD